MRIFFILAIISCFSKTYAPAQENVTATTRLKFSSTQIWKIGIVLTGQDRPSRGAFACTPVPQDFPEQKVRIIDRDVSAKVRKIKFRKLGSGARQMVINIPHIAAGESIRSVLTFEVQKQHFSAPDKTDTYRLNHRTSRELRNYLRPSPFIESQHPEIISLAHTFEHPSHSTWSRIETIYDWVRQNVTYVDSKLEGALAALRDGNGDCEEMTSLFIALCRANKIPARTVWVPGHCYPEFYVLDETGKGHWFPCQAAGDRSFGEITESRPILQKGDSFRIPGTPQKQPLRYAQLVGSQPGSGLAHPQVEIVHQQVLAITAPATEQVDPATP